MSAKAKEARIKARKTDERSQLEEYMADSISQAKAEKAARRARLKGKLIGYAKAQQATKGIPDAKIEEILGKPGRVLYNYEKAYVGAAAMFRQAKELYAANGNAEMTAKYERDERKALQMAAMHQSERGGDGRESGGGGGGGGAGGGGGGGGGGGEDPEDTPQPLDRLMSFSKIAGMQNEKVEVNDDFILPLKFPKLMRGGNALLMYGPPGNGKTMIAKGITDKFNQTLGGTAEKPKCYMFAASGAELKGKYSGETEKNLKRYFQAANDKAIASGDDSVRSILFLDEFDAIGGLRVAEDRLMTASVNTLLQLMDGIKSYTQVIVMAATNLPWALDPAILRRFSTKLLVDLPTFEGRAGIVQLALLDRVPELKKEGLDQFLPLIRNVAEWSAPSAEGRSMVVGSVTPYVDAKAAEKFFKTRLAASKDAMFPLGMSASDLSKAMTTAMNRVAMAKLRKPLEPSGCVPLCLEDTCKPCTSQEAQNLRLQSSDLLGQEAENLVKDTLQQMGSTVNVQEYVNLCLYKISGQPPAQLKRKEEEV